MAAGAGAGVGVAGVPSGRLFEVETLTTCGRFSEPAARERCATKALSDEAMIFDAMVARGEAIAALTSANEPARPVLERGARGVSMRAPASVQTKARRRGPAASGDDLQHEVTRGKVEAAYQAWIREQGGK